MSEREKSTPQSGLAQYVGENEFLADFKAAASVVTDAKKGSNTENWVAMQRRRDELEYCRAYVQAVSEMLRRGEVKKDQIQRYFAAATLVSNVGNLIGMGLLIDSLTIRDECVLRKTKEKALRRVPLTDILANLEDFTGGLANMLHDMAVSANPEVFAVRDQNGTIITEDKYMKPPKERRKRKEVDASEAVSVSEERKTITGDQIKEELNRGTE